MTLGMGQEFIQLKSGNGNPIEDLKNRKRSPFKIIV